MSDEGRGRAQIQGTFYLLKFNIALKSSISHKYIMWTWGYPDNYYVWVTGFQMTPNEYILTFCSEKLW